MELINSVILRRSNSFALNLDFLKVRFYPMRDEKAKKDDDDVPVGVLKLFV
jgi:hypothetical protein